MGILRIVQNREKITETIENPWGSSNSLENSQNPRHHRRSLEIFEIVNITENRESPWRSSKSGWHHRVSYEDPSNMLKIIKVIAHHQTPDGAKTCSRAVSQLSASPLQAGPCRFWPRAALTTLNAAVRRSSESLEITRKNPQEFSESFWESSESSKIVKKSTKPLRIR